MKPSTLAKLYNAHKDDLVGVAFAVLRHKESAEDVVHEACAKLLGTPGPFRNARAYLFRTVRNTAISKQRSALPASDQGGLQNIVGAQGPCTSEPALITALHRLPEERLQVILLKNNAGMTFAEIAKTLQISPNTAASHHRRAMAELRNLLEVQV